MLILSLKIKPHASWVHSLKRRRMVVKSPLSKMQNKLNVAVAEVGEQDIHQTIVIGVAAVISYSAQADSVTEEIRYFMEESMEAETTGMEGEIF